MNLLSYTSMEKSFSTPVHESGQEEETKFQFRGEVTIGNLEKDKSVQWQGLEQKYKQYLYANQENQNVKVVDNNDTVFVEFEIGNEYKQVYSVDMNEEYGFKKEDEWTVFVRLKNPSIRHLLYYIVDQVKFKLANLPTLNRADLYMSPLNPEPKEYSYSNGAYNQISFSSTNSEVNAPLPIQIFFENGLTKKSMAPVVKRTNNPCFSVDHQIVLDIQGSWSTHKIAFNKMGLVNIVNQLDNSKYLLHELTKPPSVFSPRTREQIPQSVQESPRNLKVPIKNSTLKRGISRDLGTMKMKKAKSHMTRKQVMNVA